MGNYIDPELTNVDPFHLWLGNDLDFGPDPFVMTKMQVQNANALRKDREEKAAQSAFAQHILTGAQSSNIEDRRAPLVKVPDGNGGYTVYQKATVTTNDKPLTGVFNASSQKGSKMPNNSLYDGILMPQGGVYEPGPAVMLPPSAPAKQSAVVRALIASDPNGPGLRDPQSGMQGGWGQMEDFASSGSPSIPGPNGTTIAKDQTRLPGQVPAQFDPVEAYSGVPRNSGQQAIETFAPRSAAFSPWGPDWTTGIGAVHQPMLLGSPGKFAGGDPWAADRFGGESVVSRPGMVTGAAPGLSPVARAIVQSAPPGNFLQDRGADTQGLNVSQIANEFNKQMSSSSRNADGSRGFGV